jgi:hypothetical protein
MKTTTIFTCTLILGFAAATTRGQPSNLMHRYSFIRDASDSVGTAHGIAQPGATFSNGAVVLDGVSGCVDLPNDLVSGYTSVTFEAWVTDNGSGGWARIYDFGNSSSGQGGQGEGTQYMFLSLPSGLGNLRGAYTITGSGSGEQIVEWSGGRPTVGKEAHIVWTSDATSGVARLYVNALQVGVNSNMTLTPALIGPTSNDWLGKSQFSADPFFKGAIDEFRVYSIALSSTDVLQDYQNGPDIVGNGPAFFFTQPQNQWATEGQTVTFTAVVDGSPPFTYQWRFNGTNLIDGTRTWGATNSVLTISGVQTGDVGNYSLVASNPRGTATSSNAMLILPHVSDGLINRYSFTVDASDSVGHADGTLMNGASITNGKALLNGAGAYVHCH